VRVIICRKRALAKSFCECRDHVLNLSGGLVPHEHQEFLGTGPEVLVANDCSNRLRFVICQRTLNLAGYRGTHVAIRESNDVVDALIVFISHTRVISIPCGERCQYVRLGERNRSAGGDG
jgi:hypothetical protein